MISPTRKMEFNTDPKSNVEDTTHHLPRCQRSNQPPIRIKVYDKEYLVDGEFDVTLYMDMMNYYRYLDNVIAHKFKRTLHKVGWSKDPEKDKHYLCLFNEIKGDFQNYQQVFSDCNFITPSREFTPESLLMAEKIVKEKQLKLDTSIIWNCLEDIITDWKCHRYLRIFKEYEEFLLRFWQGKKRMPKHNEIPKDFCVDFRERISAIDQNFVTWIDSVCSEEESIRKIEENHKKRLFECCWCRVHYIRIKFDEAEKCGLIEGFARTLPAFKRVEVRRVDIDMYLDMHMDVEK